MDSISPVLTEAEVPSEQVVALGQTDVYYPIVVARVVFEEEGGPVYKSSLTRFRFSDAERELIGKGADLILGAAASRGDDAGFVAFGDAG